MLIGTDMAVMWGGKLYTWPATRCGERYMIRWDRRLRCWVPVGQ
jgi:hypothetical protein